MYTLCENILLRVSYSSTLNSADAPIINPLTKRFNVTEGNDVELDCISDGMPLPVVTWTKVAKVLNVSQSADGRISIINATRTDAGIYICTVTNGIGKPAKATRYLNVFCKSIK